MLFVCTINCSSGWLKKSQSCNISVTRGYILVKRVLVSVEASVWEINLFYYVLNHRHSVTLEKKTCCFGFHTYKIGGDSLEKVREWITNNLETAKLRRNILAESPLSKGRSKTPYDLTGAKKITSSLNSQKAFNFWTRRMVREILLFPASHPSHMQSAINNQIWFLPWSFPLCCCSHTRTYHSSNSGPGIQVHKPRMIKLTVPKQKKEWTQVAQNEALLPKGCSVVPPKEIWMQTFHKFPGDKAQNTTHTLMWADIFSGWELFQLLTCWTHTGRASPTCLLSSCSASASHWLSLLFPLVTVGFPY